jgi:hypothetical protein
MSQHVESITEASISECTAKIAPVTGNCALPAKRGLTGLDAHERFLVREFTIQAWSGSVQHSGLYAKEIELHDPARGRFREDMIAFLDHNVVPFYRLPVTESEHIRHLRRLVWFANRSGGALFRARYNWGLAQKLLNLYLKYLWSLGLIAPPPHCPVDSIVLSKTTLKGSVKWTQLTDMQAYQRAIAAIRARATKDGYHSIAEWELERGFSRRVARGRKLIPALPCMSSVIAAA